MIYKLDNSEIIQITQIKKLLQVEQKQNAKEKQKVE